MVVSIAKSKNVLKVLTCMTIPRSGRLTVSPGTGLGQRSISLHATSILASPQEKYSGEISKLTLVKRLTNGSREMITTLWNKNNFSQWTSYFSFGDKAWYTTYLLKIPSGNSLILYLSEIDIAIEVTRLNLEVGWTFLIISSMLRSQGVSTRRLPYPHMKLSVTHTSWVGIRKGKVAYVCLFLLW